MGVWGKMAPVDNLELERLRQLDALDVLRLLGGHVKVDRDFKPTRSVATRRVHVSVAGADWELLLNGSRFYDTHSRSGGGGAIDLAMHLWRVPFKRAIAMLQEVGA